MRTISRMHCLDRRFDADVIITISSSCTELNKVYLLNPAFMSMRQ